MGIYMSAHLFGLGFGNGDNDPIGETDKKLSIHGNTSLMDTDLIRAGGLADPGCAVLNDQVIGAALITLYDCIQIFI